MTTAEMTDFAPLSIADFLNDLPANEVTGRHSETTV